MAPTEDEDRAALRRDRRHRRSLLMALYAVRRCPGDGWCDGPFMRDLAAATVPDAGALHPGGHVIGLTRGLVRAGYARARRSAYDRDLAEPAAWRFRITASGAALALGLSGTDPLIDDPIDESAAGRRGRVTRS